MSLTLTRSPLTTIGMNGGGGKTTTKTKRRSARLSSQEEGAGQEENEPPNKKSKADDHHDAAAVTKTVATKRQDGGGTTGDSGAVGTRGRKRKQEYTEEADGFSFARKTRSKVQGAAGGSTAPDADPQAARETKRTAATSKAKVASGVESRPADDTGPPPTIAQKKQRKQLPSTPELKATAKPVRRSKRLSNENEQHEPPSAKKAAQSPFRSAHAKSHANTDALPLPSPERVRPVTVEKRRKEALDGGGVEEEKIMKIALPFADTPIIRRNKTMRKISAERDGGRRSSGGLRGRRASSMIDEGRGNALPHIEVPTSEFYKHISEELTEPRRMRCLLGWCGNRTLPPKPDPPKENTAQANLEFQAAQAARVVQEELGQDLVSNGLLSDWFSRDANAPPAPVLLRKKANPRNIANLAKAEELERELERLKAERAAWDDLLTSTISSATLDREAAAEPKEDGAGGISPLHPELLDPTQQAILSQLQSTSPSDPQSTAPGAIQERLQTMTSNLEFTIDAFAAGVHQLAVTKEVADTLAETTLASAARVLDQRATTNGGDIAVADGTGTGAGEKAPGVFETLRGLSKELNGIVPRDRGNSQWRKR